jgi:hypothetical protein
VVITSTGEKMKMLKLAISSLILPLVLFPQVNYAELEQRQKQRPSQPAPVAVSDLVLEDKGSHLVVSKLKIKNLSTKTIRAIKYNWYLIKREEDTDVIWRKGLDTNFIQLPKDLKAGDELELEGANIRIDKVLLRVELDNNHRIQVVATNLIFADGAMWRRSVQVIPL